MSRDIIVVSDEEAELKKRGYNLGSSLGEGSYAKVKSAFSEKLQKNVALKIINRKKAPKDFREKFLPRELEIIACVDHQHAIKMYDIFEFHNKVSNTVVFVYIYTSTD
jgi:serine kinase